MLNLVSFPIDESELPGPSIAECRARVYRLARRWRLSPEDAEDVAQEAAVRLLRWPHLCIRLVGPWLERLTAQCISAHRRQLARHFALTEELSVEPRPIFESDVPRLRAAFARLSQEENFLLILRYELGWSHPAIAEALGMSEGAARAAAFRLRHRLRRDLRDLVGSC